MTRRLIATSITVLGLSALASCKLTSPTELPEAATSLRVGQQITLYAPAGWQCPIRASGSAQGAEKYQGVDLAGHQSVASPSTMTVMAVKPTPDAVAVQVRQKSGALSWLALPRGKVVPCVFSDPKPLQAAMARVGKQWVFAPWQESCAALHASGQAPESVLVESEPGVQLEATDVALGPQLAQEFSGKAVSAPDVLWVEFGKGLLKVRADSVAGCFVEAGTDAATPPEDLALRLAPGRCERDSAEASHVECRSTLSMWSGFFNTNALDLTRVRRTLGPVHFYNSKPVDGSRFARTVLDVSLRATADVRSGKLANAMAGAVNGAVREASGGAARVAAPGETDVTYRVQVTVANATVGELQQREEQHTSRYVARTYMVDNPKKDELRNQVSQADERVSQAQQDYDESKRNFDRLKQEAISECEKQAAKSDSAVVRGFGGAACGLGHLVQPSRSSLDQAEADRSAAQSAYASEPSQLKKEEHADHPYRKVVYARQANASLNLVLERVADGQKKEERIPIRYEWSDYEVAAEPRYNVQGHRADRGPIDDGERLVGPLGARMAQVIAVKVKQTVVAAALEEAKRAFLASGAETKAGYEMVDAIAYDAVGKRLKRVALRGRASLLANVAFDLPVSAAVPGAGQCLLAVAVAPEGSENTKLTLSTPDKFHADLRGRAAALLEVCPGEAGKQKAEKLLLGSPDQGEVKWGLYLTELLSAAEAPPSEPAAE